MRSLSRRVVLAGITVAALVLLAAPAAARGDAFDRYTNDVLAKVPGAPGVKQIKQLTPAMLAEHGNVLPGIEGTFLVVKTNQGRSIGFSCVF